MMRLTCNYLLTYLLILFAPINILGQMNYKLDELVTDTSVYTLYSDINISLPLSSDSQYNLYIFSTWHQRFLNENDRKLSDQILLLLNNKWIFQNNREALRITNNIHDGTFTTAPIKQFNKLIEVNSNGDKELRDIYYLTYFGLSDDEIEKFGDDHILTYKNDLNIYKGIESYDHRVSLYKDILTSLIIPEFGINSEEDSEQLRQLEQQFDKEFGPVFQETLIELHNRLPTNTTAYDVITGGLEIMDSKITTALISQAHYTGHYSKFISGIKVFNNVTSKLGPILGGIGVSMASVEAQLKTVLLASYRNAITLTRLENLKNILSSSSINDQAIIEGFSRLEEEYADVETIYDDLLEATLSDYDFWSTSTVFTASLILAHYAGPHAVFLIPITITKWGWDQMIDLQTSCQMLSLTANLEENLRLSISSGLTSDNEIYSQLFNNEFRSYLSYYFFENLAARAYGNNWLQTWTFLNINSRNEDLEAAVELLKNHADKRLETYTLSKSPYFLMTEWNKMYISLLFGRVKGVENITRLYSGLVTPNPGSNSDIFEFSIICESFIGQPQNIDLIIDGANYTMDKDPSDNDFTNGVKYSCSLTFNSTGTKNYYYSAINSDNTTIRWPLDEQLSLTVNQSAAGYDIQIDPNNTSISSGISKGGYFDVTIGIYNDGENNYTSVPYKAELFDQSGTLLSNFSGVVENLASKSLKSIANQMLLPSNVSDESFSVVTTVNPELDEDYSNNTHTNYFYIGESLPNEQFKCDDGKEQYTKGDNIVVSGETFGTTSFNIYGVSASNGYIGVTTPSGDRELIQKSELEVFGTIDRCIYVDDIIDFDSGYTNVYAGSVISSGGVNFNQKQISTLPGKTIHFSATAPSGLYFDGDWDDHLVLTTSLPNNIESWYKGASFSNGDQNAEFRFDIPSNISTGTYRFYFLNDYASPSQRVDITRLEIQIIDPIPTIQSISSNMLSADDIITISGSHFGSEGQVKFGDIASTEIVSWTSNTISCKVPEGISNNNLVVVNPQGTSNSISYSVLSSTGAPYIVNTIPDQIIYPNTTLSIGNINELFSDPNGDPLSFSSNASDENISINVLSNEISIAANNEILQPIEVTLTVTDITNKSVSESFVLNIPDRLWFSPESHKISYQSNQLSVEVFSNVGWDASDEFDWIDIGITNNLVNISILDNDSDQEREGYVIIKGDGLPEQYCYIVQEYNPNQDLSINLSKDFFPEDWEVGSIMAAFTILNTEEGKTYTLSVDNDFFSINSSNQLVLQKALDHEIFPTMDIVVTATDSNGASYEEYFQIRIDNINEVPVVTSIDLTPENPLSSDDLELYYLCQDPDNGGGSNTSGDVIHWYKDGVHQTGLDGQTIISNSLTAEGEVWYATVQPLDADETVEDVFGEEVTSNSVTVTGSGTITECGALVITLNKYSETVDLSTSIQGELGDSYTVADWNDLKNIDDIDGWISCMKLQHDQTFMLERNGSAIYGSNRQYYVHYSTDGLPYSGFMVHDQIDNKLFLGSWYGLSMNILAKYSEQKYQSWTHQDGDLSCSKYFNGTQTHAVSGDLNIKQTFNSINITSNSLLTGNVTGDQLIELVTVQDNVLYIIDSNGVIINSVDISISGIPYSYATMLEDFNNDGLLDIGIGYHRGNSNYGSLKSRIYDGQLNLLLELTKNVSSDGHMKPWTIVDGDVITTMGCGYGRDPRGFSRWSGQTQTELWHYDVGPSTGQTSIADADQDGDLEITGLFWNPHNGATGTGNNGVGTQTTDGDMWCIVIDENGNEEFSLIYPSPSNGAASHKFVDFDGDGTCEILAEENHSSSYAGTSQLHIMNLSNGATNFTLDGLGTRSVGFQTAIADMNNDGIKEIVASNYMSGTTFNQYVLSSNFSQLNSSTEQGYVCAVGDLTGDGLNNIVLRYNSTLKVLGNTLQLIDSYDFTENIINAIISDVDNNGVNEVIVAADQLYTLEFDGLATGDIKLLNAILSVYPNPTKGELKLQLKNGMLSDILIKVINSTGQQVYNQKLSELNYNKPYNIDLSNYKSGVYFIQITNKEISETIKIIKQ